MCNKLIVLGIHDCRIHTCFTPSSRRNYKPFFVFTDVTSLEDTIVEAADGNVDMSHDNMK